MGRTLRHRNPIWVLALTILVGGCATPIGIRIADPREVQVNLTRSALTDDEPSDASLNQLRRYDLLQAYKDDPDATLAKLHADALAEGLPPDALFALAELSFLRAEATKRQAQYAATVVYAYALLFPEHERARLDPLDPRERIAADLYNRALTLAFKRTKTGTIPLSARSGVIELPFGHISVSLSPDMLQIDGIELYDFQPVAEIEVEGLRNRYRRPGIGAPLAAKTRPLPGVVPVVPVGPVVRVPLSAVLIIDSPLAGIRTGDLSARLELLTELDTETIEIGGHAAPLEAEPTAALAASLAESQFWKQEMRVFLGDALGVRGKSALGALGPYQKGRIPVVFVHGTASSAARWANMVNDLAADPRLRKRYTFWFFKYDSGNPIVYSGYQLRDTLTQAVDRADPSGVDPCVRDMVVMGHSQGGLLTKLAVVDSGDAFWTNVTHTPFDEVTLKPDDRELLRNVMFVKPLPFVTEVIFLATPHRGSYLAGPQFVRRLAAYLVSLPSDIIRVGSTITALASAGAGGLRMPTSIDNMSPGHPFIKKLANIPVTPTVTAHSIIAVDDDSPLDRAGDGVVKYESAHVDGVASELIVRSPQLGNAGCATVHRGSAAHPPRALREVAVPDASGLRPFNEPCPPMQRGAGTNGGGTECAPRRSGSALHSRINFTFSMSPASSSCRGAHEVTHRFARSNEGGCDLKRVRPKQEADAATHHIGEEHPPYRLVGDLPDGEPLFEDAPVRAATTSSPRGRGNRHVGELALHVRLFEPVRSTSIVVDTAHRHRGHCARSRLSARRRRHRLHRAHRDCSAGGNHGRRGDRAGRVGVVAAGPVRVLIGFLAAFLHVLLILLTVLLELILLVLAVLLHLILLLLATLRLRSVCLLALPLVRARGGLPLRLILARGLLPRALAAAPLRLRGLRRRAAGALAPSLRRPAAAGGAPAPSAEGATGRRTALRESTGSATTAAGGAATSTASTTSAAAACVGRPHRDEAREHQHAETPTEALLARRHLESSFLPSAGRRANAILSASFGGSNANVASVTCGDRSHPVRRARNCGLPVSCS
jgi:hypothetical protein